MNSKRTKGNHRIKLIDRILPELAELLRKKIVFFIEIYNKNVSVEANFDKKTIFAVIPACLKKFFS